MSLLSAPMIPSQRWHWVIVGGLGWSHARQTRAVTIPAGGDRSSKICPAGSAMVASGSSSPDSINAEAVSGEVGARGFCSSRARYADPVAARDGESNGLLGSAWSRTSARRMASIVRSGSASRISARKDLFRVARVTGFVSSAAGLGEDLASPEVSRACRRADKSACTGSGPSVVCGSSVVGTGTRSWSERGSHLNPSEWTIPDSTQSESPMPSPLETVAFEET